MRSSIAILFFSLLLWACDEKEITIDIEPECEGDFLVTLTFENQTNVEQHFEVHYFQCDSVILDQEIFDPGESKTIILRTNSTEEKSFVVSPLLDIGCNLTVQWQEDPLTSPYQVIYPDYSCWGGDRFRTGSKDGESYEFQIIDKPPCVELNRNFSLIMENKLDTTVHLFLESGSLGFYSGTSSQTFNPKCRPNMCCQDQLEIAGRETDSVNWLEDYKINFFTLHSIGYEEQDWSLDKLLPLFNPEEGLTDSIVHIEIRGVVLDSLIVTFSN